MVEPLDLNTTYEELMEQKLAKFSEMDKRETSPLYIATAANSAETAQMLATIKHNIDLMFADTAPREFLIRRAAERGIKPREATHARLKGVFNIDVPIGSRFNLDELNYVVKEWISEGEYILECETAGNIGNLFLGNLIPIDYINGLTSAELTEILIPGEDEEDTESLRKRYFDSFNNIAFGGNRADYKQKVGFLEGVGGVRVYRAWNGGGTVKLVIIDSQYQKPTQTLIDAVQEAVDPIDMQGEGVGIAPIDHIVTVFGVNEELIDIEFNITYKSGWSWDNIQSDIYSMIDDYFKELAQEWANPEDDDYGVVVRISQLETRIINIDGILDVVDTKLNGNSANVILDKESIPKRGTVNG